MEEIKKELQPQGIIAVKRISIRYSVYVLTIKGQNIPKKIKLDIWKKKHDLILLTLKDVFNARNLDIPRIRVKVNGCGEGHNLDDCQNEPKCVNCQGDHGAIWRDCPKWNIEKDIVTLKYTEKISFAVKRLQPSFNPSKDSYATVAWTPPQSARPLPPWARKIRLPIDFKAEIE